MSKHEFAVDVLSTHRVDKEKEEDGIKVFMSDDDTQDEEKRSWVMVSRWGNPRFNSMMQKKMKPHIRQVTNGTFPRDKQDAIQHEVVAKTICRDWGGHWFQKDGKPVPYSWQAMVTVLENVPCVKDDVENGARDEAQFRVEETRRTAGNSPTS